MTRSLGPQPQHHSLHPRLALLTVFQLPLWGFGVILASSFCRESALSSRGPRLC